MIIATPNASNIACASRTTTGTLLTVPAGTWWCGDLLISASVSVALTATPRVTTSGANASPASGTVIHQLSITGLAAVAVTDSAMISVIVYADPANDITLEFNTGGASSASVVANGVLLT